MNVSFDVNFPNVIVSIKFSGTAASSDLVIYAILKTGMELKVRVVAFNFCPKLDIVAKKTQLKRLL